MSSVISRAQGTYKVAQVRSINAVVPTAGWLSFLLHGRGTYHVLGHTQTRPGSSSLLRQTSLTLTQPLTNRPSLFLTRSLDHLRSHVGTHLGTLTPHAHYALQASKRGRLVPRRQLQEDPLHHKACHCSGKQQPVCRILHCHPTQTHLTHLPATALYPHRSQHGDRTRVPCRPREQRP